MPLIQVYLLKGRTGQQKRRLIRELTDVMVDVLGSRPERVNVVVHEVDADNWGLGGVPLSDEAVDIGRVSS
jgi:4-oxalocrotonate tautomerase